MKKSHIAVLVSLLFAVPAGMVALAQSGSATTETMEVVAVPAEPVVVTEQVAVVTDQSAQPVVIAESTTVAIPVEVVVQPKQMSMAEWQRINSFRTDEVPMLPRQIAYYERLESQRGPLMASSAVTGANGEDEFKLSPAQTAFFDRAEQQRLARLQPQQPVAAIEIQSPSQEVVIADSSAIR
jgi:hypothetical protein